MKIGVRFRVAIGLVAVAFGFIVAGPLRATIREAWRADDAPNVATAPVDTPARTVWTGADGASVRVVPLPHRVHAERARRRGRIETAAMVFGIVIALLSVLLMLRSPLKRIKRLADDVRRSSKDGYAFVTAVDGTDEIGDLARAFNEAATEVRGQIDKLEKRDRALTEYIHGMTHDLAIPLTVLQGRLTQLEADAKASRAPDADTVNAAFAECQYLAQLVANLGAAARLDTGDTQVDSREVDLNALVERVVARHKPVADHRGVTLDFAVPDERVVTVGDDLLLERAVSNLVHNAIRHIGRPRGEGHVAVVLDRVPDGFSLLVKDDGTQASAALAAALERGGDLQPSSSRGTGLGMRIVRDVARKHGLSLTFDVPAEGGFEARLVTSHAAIADRPVTNS